MLSSVKLSPESIEKSREMGHILGQGRGSTQQTLDAVKEKIPLSWKEKSLFYQDKHKVGHSFAEPSLDPNSELRQNASTKKVVQSKPSERNDRRSHIGHRTSDDDELVKHMSNLPGFLQRVEKENSIQEKALNFGVLDWKRLEKWKYTERMPGKYPKKTSPSRSSCTASGPPKMVPNLRKQPSSHGRNPSPLYSGKQPIPHGSRFSSPQRQPTLPQSSLVNSSKEARNAIYRKMEKCDEPIKSKEKETCNQESQTAESSTIGRQQEHFQQAAKFNSMRKDSKKKTASENKASPSEGSKHNHSFSSHNKTNAQGKKSEIRFNNEVKFTSESCTADPQNIVLLVPKHFPKKSCSERSQFTESRTSLDGQLTEVAGNRLSDLFSSQELYSGELSADIPHSCPLPSGATVECAMGLHNSVTSEAVDTDICPSACPSANPVTSITSEGKRSIMHEETAWSSSLVEDSSKTQADVAAQPTVQGRASSPARRFSFNLGRMSRSFSFKESSAVPQLSSTYTSVKSGPVRPEVSSGMDNSEREKASASNRGRSSPLRRLLEPLLKNKGAQSSENVGVPNGRLHSMTVRTTATKGPYQGRKPEASSFQALLQLTVKNGLPFFKLVVDNSNDMLAATVKKLPTPEKSDPCMIFSFYSVHEIRKKSMNWISQGSKGKSCSLGYNFVGQMNISNTYHMKANTGDFSECSRECVLYGVDPGQVDKQTLEFAANKEIAAIIVRNSSKKPNDAGLSDDHQMNKGREYLPGMTLDTGENKHSNGIVAILPGGVHGLPIKGAPSSLISRWRSGGSCDCGGWDVGCKLRILADRKNSSNVLQDQYLVLLSITLIFTYRRKTKSNKPVFTMEPFSNGFYSIELDASVSYAEHLPEVNIGADKRKTASTFQEQFPAKYVTCPPLSPVGRI
ncbi:UNVERIFIED_CONTAM: hypothetical protein Sangu_1346700 [Sesamum angustifolium]|uniref:DUF3527 domain protein n=1 Tax=Sesamum angustifolium TaxID=2727405 RepID=A0AAW2N728_9LAMI